MRITDVNKRTPKYVPEPKIVLAKRGYRRAFMGGVYTELDIVRAKFIRLDFSLILRS